MYVEQHTGSATGDYYQHACIWTFLLLFLELFLDFFWTFFLTFVVCETLIIFLAIENNNLIIHSDPWIKSERDSIRNSWDVFFIIKWLQNYLN